jgi:hypothetical protein
MSSKRCVDSLLFGLAQKRRISRGDARGRVVLPASKQ